MTLRFPRDPVFELYLGRWVNLTTRVRQTDPVTSTWGSSAEQGRIPPSTFDCVLDNAGGTFTPGNPASTYYDYLLGRNVPVRWALRVSQDTFTRSVTGTWGTTDTSDVWSATSSGSGSQSVSSGEGIHSVGAANAFQLAYLGDNYVDCQVAATLTATNVSNVTGGNLEPLNLVLRYQTSGTFSGEHYLLRVVFNTSEVASLTIFHSSLGALSSTVSIGAVTTNTPNLRAKFQVEGQTLRGKLYTAGPSNDPDQFEPLDWQVSAHHERLVDGLAGLRSGVATGNSNTKPVTFNYDTWDVRIVRFTGEVAKLTPGWDESHRVKWVKLHAADVTQRLGRPERASLSSAARRYLAGNADLTATDFWPLDESATAPQQGLNALGGEIVRFERLIGTPDKGAVEYGKADNVLTSVPSFATVSNQGGLRFIANATSLGSAFSFSWLMNLSSDEGAQVFISTAAFTNRFVFFFNTDGTWTLFINPGSVTLMTGTFDVPVGLDGQWLAMSFTSYTAGGNVGYYTVANGIDQGGGSSVVAAYSPLNNVFFYAPGATTGGRSGASISSVFVTATRMDDLTTDPRYIILGSRVANILKGWPNERATTRASRLCTEESVSFDYFGDANTSPPLGPQRPLPLLDLVQECADADQGALYPTRFTAGLALRTRRSLGGQAVTATLDYASQQVAALAPSADDRVTANVARAERVNGGFTVVEQTTGPMNTGNPGTTADAIGRSPASTSVNVESDAQLFNVAGWLRALGTNPDVRFPRISVNLRAAGVPVALQYALLALNVGDRLQVQGLTNADIYDVLDELTRGGTETIADVYRHVLALNTAPYKVYGSGTFGDSGSRFADEYGGTTLTGSLSSSATGGQSVTISKGQLWTTRAAMFPLDVVCEGERITLSAISGASSPQTFTISTRAVNGVSKAHAAGAKISLFAPVYFA